MIKETIRASNIFFFLGRSLKKKTTLICFFSLLSKKAIQKLRNTKLLLAFK